MCFIQGVFGAAFIVGDLIVYDKSCHPHLVIPASATDTDGANLTVSIFYKLHYHSYMSIVGCRCNGNSSSGLYCFASVMTISVK